MKFSLSWLKQHLDTDASLTEICDKLTAIGLEVEGVEDAGKKLAPFIVAQVLEAVPHPNADRLVLCRLQDGSGGEKIVLTGAPNLQPYKGAGPLPQALKDQVCARVRELLQTPRMTVTEIPEPPETEPEEDDPDDDDDVDS